jgi:hypothetical protein
VLVSCADGQTEMGCSVKCCERSERVKALATELRVMLEWESVERQHGGQVEQYEMEGRVARDLRRSQIVEELIRMRQTCEMQLVCDEPPVRGCGVRKFFGEGACARVTGLAEAWASPFG